MHIKTEIEDELNCYPRVLKDGEDIVDVPVKETDTRMTKGKEWYMDTLKMKGEKGWIDVIYSMIIKRIYDK